MKQHRARITTKSEEQREKIKWKKCVTSRTVTKDITFMLSQLQKERRLGQGF